MDKEKTLRKRPGARISPSPGMAPTVTIDMAQAEGLKPPHIRDKLVKIGAKIVRHGRYNTFQMAEVAVPRDLFRGILRLIDGLRRPCPAAG